MGLGRDNGGYLLSRGGSCPPRGQLGRERVAVVGGASSAAPGGKPAFEVSQPVAGSVDLDHVAVVQ